MSRKPEDSSRKTADGSPQSEARSPASALRPPSSDLSQLSMLELFRVEAENQTTVLTSGLLELESRGRPAAAGEGATQLPSSQPSTPRLSTLLAGLMRAAHSLKGAARIVNLDAPVKISHAMEDCFVAAQKGDIRLGQREIDLLFRGVDLLQNIARRVPHAGPPAGDENAVRYAHEHSTEIQDFLQSIRATVGSGDHPAVARGQQDGRTAKPPDRGTTDPWSSGPMDSSPGLPALPESNRSLNRLLGLASESMVQSRWLESRVLGRDGALLRLKRMQSELVRSVEALRQAVRTTRPQDYAWSSGPPAARGISGRADSPALSPPAAGSPEVIDQRFSEVLHKLTECEQGLTERLGELEGYDRRSAGLSHRLYQEVLQTRMRPFGDGVRRFQRMVRDLARALGKEVRLEVRGETTQVDRDILEKLEGPLVHLLRNAVDHGCEPPAERAQQNKPPEAVITLEARHAAGLLQVTVSDDGRGVAVEQLRRAVMDKNLASPGIVQRLSEAELLEFLFLPGFSLKEDVTEISGRGVGLDAVASRVRGMRGTIRAATVPGRGMRFHMQLPLTLSVLRALFVEIAGERYAFPLGQILRTLKVRRRDVEVVEGRLHFRLPDPASRDRVALLSAHQLLEYDGPRWSNSPLSVVVIGPSRLPGGIETGNELAAPKFFGATLNSLFRDGGGQRTSSQLYGLVVDRFLDERELVVQPLDSRLGKIPNISAAALLEDGSPALVIDPEDLLRSVEKAASRSTRDEVQSLPHAAGALESTDDGPRTIPRTRDGLRRVLAVDDSATVREVIRKLLARHGFDPETAVDGMDAWNALRAQRFDLVITDVDMPRLDGIELTRLIRNDSRLGTLPVMIISYKDRDADRMSGLEAGADYYLTKGSFDEETLVQAVIDLIGEP